MPPINTNLVTIEPKKKYEYDLYCLWRSIPAFFRFPPIDKKTKERPSPREFAMSMGIENEEMLNLVDLTTQKEFGARFNVDEGTLCDWNKTVGAQNGMDEAMLWAKNLSKNVLFSLYNTAIRKGNMLEVKLWFQLVEKWSEKQTVEHDYKGVASVSYEVVPVPARKVETTTNG
jgi:hypothetical protein